MSHAEPSPNTSDELKPDKLHATHRFTLRTLFAAVGVVAVIAATLRWDVLALFLACLPIVLLGFAFISGPQWGKVRTGLLVGWYIFCALFCYWWPYLTCPIDLPPSAHNLYVTNQGVLFGHHHEVRFDATVDDCITTAERVQKRFAAEAGHNIQPPVEIDLQRGVFPPSVSGGSRREWWLDISSIQKGLYYPGGGSWHPEIWIDTDRGVFYFRVTD